jgi:Xaa-Pro aminopeptidase
VTAASRAERRDRLRREADARGLDGILFFSWRRGALNWVTGYTPGFVSNFGTFWLPVDGQPVLGIRFGFDRSRAEAVTGHEVVVAVQPATVVPNEATRIGLVTGDFAINECPVALIAELERRQVETVDLVPLVDELRAIKSAGEIDALVAATEVAEAGISTLQGSDLTGQTDFALAAAVEAEARRLGAQRALCLVGIGDGAIVTEPSGVGVGEGEVTCIELTVHTASACTQVAATFMPASAPPHSLRAVEACRETRALIVDALKPGEPIKNAVSLGHQSLAQHTLGDAFEYDFGHGVGVDTPEQPLLSRDEERMVEVGMVVAVHVAVRRIGGETAFIGGPVVVEASGSRELLANPSWA